MRRVTSPVGIALLFAAGVGALAWLLGWGFLVRYPWVVLSGGLVEPRPVMVGGALDQTNLTSLLFRSALLLIGGAIVGLAVRLLTSLRSWPARAVFRSCGVAVFLPGLAALTVSLYEILRTLTTLGVTPTRLAGVAVCLAGFAAVGVFLWGVGWWSGRLAGWGSEQARAGRINSDSLI